VPLIKFQNKNRYGNIRTRIFYHPTTNFGINPKGLGNWINVSSFKYEYTDPILPPHLYTNPQGQKFILPSWQPVLPETTLEDIVWIRKEVKKDKETYNSWNVKSSDGINEYKVIQKGINNFSCNCIGFATHRGICRHVKEIKNIKLLDLFGR